MRAGSVPGLLGLLLIGQGSSCDPQPEEKPDPVDSGEAPVPTEERCDGLDNDLDGEVDEGATDALLWYADSDGDGYGDDAVTTWSCTAPSGTSALGGDCADEDAQRFPGAAEVCGGSTDTDCDGLAGCDDGDCMADAACTEDCTDGVDNDGDGLADCEDGDCMADAACTEDCADGVDNDGDGLVDCWDDACWSACGTTVRSHLQGGRMSASYAGMWAFSESGWELDGTAWSLWGWVEVAHATGSVDCAWTASSARFWVSGHGTLSSGRGSVGGHDHNPVVLSSGCPVAWPEVLPPQLTALGLWPATPSGPWYSGEVAAMDDYRANYSATSIRQVLVAVDTLQPATASWSYR